MNLNEYLTKNIDKVTAWMTRRMELNSGLTLSIQASEFHYCQPRKNLVDKSQYLTFEIGFPSEEIELISSFAEDPSNPTETVYPNVPREHIETIISDNGGIKGVAE